MVRIHHNQNNRSIISHKFASVDLYPGFYSVYSCFVLCCVNKHRIILQTSLDHLFEQTEAFILTFTFL